MQKPYQKIEEEIGQEITAYLSESKMEYSKMEASKKISYDEFMTNKLLIINMIREGFTYSIFKLIQEYTPFTEQDWADFLNISTKSLQRYKQSANHKFKPMHTEKIIEIAEVTKVGLELFEDVDKFKLWLNTPNYALGSHKPMELLKDSYGKDLILQELMNVQHGIFI